MIAHDSEAAELQFVIREECVDDCAAIDAVARAAFVRAAALSSRVRANQRPLGVGCCQWRTASELTLSSAYRSLRRRDLGDPSVWYVGAHC